MTNLSDAPQTNTKQSMRRVWIGVVCAAIILVLAIAPFLLRMGMVRIRLKQQSIASQSNLHLIGIVCLMYADANGGALPPDLGALAGLEPELKIYVSSQNLASIPPNAQSMTVAQKATWINAHSDYAYCGAGYIHGSGLPVGVAPSNVVVAYEKDSAHIPGEVNILYLDFHVFHLPLDQARQKISDSNALHAHAK